MCLDSWFSTGAGAAIALTPFGSRRTPVRSFSAQVGSELRALLDQLDELGLYLRPLNSASRGGRRFIFHVAALADALTEAVRAGLPRRMLRGFSHVNPVFRCDRFEPGDERFRAHVDSPYRDASRGHISRYTLLLYLTGGRGEPVLQFGDELLAEPASGQKPIGQKPIGQKPIGQMAIDEVAALTAIVFPQRLAHEGGPFLDGRKVFLRTELIFTERELTYVPGIAQLFAEACYLTGESVFEQELARYTHELYDRAAAAHWRGVRATSRRKRFSHKRYEDIESVANGYHYWFARGRLSLRECAAITLLDALNTTVAGAAFRKLCTSRVIARGGDDATWIADLLAAFAGPERARSGRGAGLPELDTDALFPEPEEPMDDMGFPTSPDWELDPFPGDRDAARYPGVVDVYARAQAYALKRILAAPVTALGQEVFVRLEHFVVEGDKIYVRSSRSLAPIHFAGAVFYDSENFIGVDVRVDAPKLLVPPILFRQNERVIHLMFDLFRNGWMVDEGNESVPVPRVIDDPEARTERNPWLDAAAESFDLATVCAELGIEKPR